MQFINNSNTRRTAGNIASVLFGVFIVLQLLLAAGLLPITIFWGGRQTELTPVLRATSVGSALLLGGFIYVIRYRAGLLKKESIPTSIRILSWVVTAYIALNILGNFLGQSAVERFAFGPLTVIIFIACLIVSLSR